MPYITAAKSATIVIKLIRFAFIWLAVRIATRLHEARYFERVYGEDKKPPSLNSVVTNIIILLIVFHVSILALVSTLANKNILPRTVVIYALTESVVYTAFVAFIAYTVGKMVMKKTYFDYKNSGVRAIRAYRELVMWCLFPISLSPIFFTT